jgi:hypothetical protein
MAVKGSSGALLSGEWVLNDMVIVQAAVALQQPVETLAGYHLTTETRPWAMAGYE